VLHHRARDCARGSHPAGTVVAEHESDNCGSHPLSQASEGIRRSGYLMATALGGDAMPPSRFIGTDTIMNS